MSKRHLAISLLALGLVSAAYCDQDSGKVTAAVGEGASQLSTPALAGAGLLGSDPSEWVASGVIECSISDFSMETSGSSYVYTFTSGCTVRALTNLHFTVIRTGEALETDKGYFAAGEELALTVASGVTLGLTAVPVEPEDIPSAKVTPSGSYTSERSGPYTTYTFTGTGSVSVDRPGVIDLRLVGYGMGEDKSISRAILNANTTVAVSTTEGSVFGPYSAAAGTGTESGYVAVRVWDEYALYESGVDITGAALGWGVAAIDGTASVRLQYGASEKSLDKTIMLAADVGAGAGGVAEITGLDPESTYYAQLYVDSGSGYAAVGEMLQFTTGSLLSSVSDGREISAGEPPVPGLKAGYLNSRNPKVALSNTSIKWIANQMGIIAVTNNQDNGGVTTYPPIWANNRTWVFHGYMYFDGEHYYRFGESIDDDTVLVIDGQTLIDDTSWNNFATAVVKPTEGWHPVEFRFANGTGGAGLYNGITDKNGDPCGFGYGISTSNQKPASMSELEWLRDTGDGLLLRAEPPTTRTVSLTGFEIDETQYSITISNGMNYAVTAELYYGESSDIATLTNDASSLWVTVDMAARETVVVDIQWEGDAPPNYTVVFPGIGASDVQSLTAGARVAAAVKSVGSDSAVLATGVGFDLALTGDAPSVTLAAYYGSSDGGTTAASWESSQALAADVTDGTYDYTLSGLELGRSYVVRVAATDEGGNTVWSDAVTLSTSGVYLGDAVSVYENDPRGQKLTVHRTGSSADLAKSVTVFLSYSGDGLSSVSSLPGSVTFASGSATASIAFTPADNARKDGDRSFTATLIAGSSYSVIAPASGTVTIVDDESAEGDVVTWTGAVDSKWETAGNWDKEFAPRSIDTVVFADGGLPADGTGVVDLGSDAGIRALRIETARAFSVSGGGSLAVNSVARIDSDGVEEGLVTIGVPVVVGNAENGYTRWNIAGSNGIALMAPLSSADGIRFFKEGDGALWLNAADTEYGGPWYIYGGTVYAAARNSIAGSATIGTGDAAASLEATVDYAVAAPFSPTVCVNGSYVSKAHGDAGAVSERVTVDGGVADLGTRYSAHQAYLTGGRVTGGLMYSREQVNQRIVSSASSVPSVLGCDYRIGAASNPLDVTVADGEAAVDLTIGGRVYYGADAKSPQYFTKFGTGTLRTLADWTGMSLGVEIAAGRVLVDNPTADGLGNQAIQVDAGATLGGIGFIGGTTASYSTSSAVTVAGQGNNEGSIAPGTVDDSGNHVIGTLTVGSPSKEGSVSFANYTKLTVHVGANGAADLLQVYGPVSVAQGAGTRLEIVCDDPSLAGGRVVVLRATGGITGTFHGVAAPGPNWKVVYTENEVAVVAPQPGRKVIIR